MEPGQCCFHRRKGEGGKQEQGNREGTAHKMIFERVEGAEQLDRGTDLEHWQRNGRKKADGRPPEAAQLWAVMLS